MLFVLLSVVKLALAILVMLQAMAPTAKLEPLRKSVRSLGRATTL